MTIHIFDFDGVIASPVQDLVFRLPWDDSEEAVLAKACKHYNIIRDKDPICDRYNALQAWILYSQVKTNFGPLFQELQNVQAAGEKWYLLTARCSTNAILNCIEFLQAYYLNPIEMYFVGSGGKVAQINNIANKWKEESVIFYDDSSTHIEGANALGLPNLEARKIDVDMSLLDEAKALYLRMQNDFE